MHLSDSNIISMAESEKLEKCKTDDLESLKVSLRNLKGLITETKGADCGDCWNRGVYTLKYHVLHWNGETVATLGILIVLDMPRHKPHHAAIKKGLFETFEATAEHIKDKDYD